MKSLVLERPCRRGDRGENVVLVQEWLCLRGYHVVVDGIFGPATDSAVCAFQRSAGLPTNGVVDEQTFRWLAAPMMSALRQASIDQQSLGHDGRLCAATLLAASPKDRRAKQGTMGSALHEWS